MSATVVVHAAEAKTASPLRDLPWLAGRLLRWAPWYTAAWAALIVADAAFTALTLWATRGTVNAVVSVVGASTGLAPAALWLSIMASVQAGARLVGLLRPYVRERVRVRAGAAIQRDALGKVARLPLETFDIETTHDVIRRVADGADTRGPDLIAEALGVAQQVPSIIVNAIFLGAIALWLPLAAAAMEVVFIWQMVGQGRRERAFSVDWTRQRRLTGYYASLLTTRAPAAEVRLWRLSGELIRRWRVGFWAHAQAKHRLSVRETLQFLPSTAIASVFVVAAVWGVVAFHGRVEPGLAALFLTAFFGVMAGMNMIQRSFREFVGHAGYAADLRRLLEDIPPEDGPPAGAFAFPTVPLAGDDRGVPAVPREVRPGVDATDTPCPDSGMPVAGRPDQHRMAPHPIPPSAAVPTPWPRRLTTGFRLVDVHYRYPGAAEEALRGVDAVIPAGRIVAIVGANGAGKSTLAALLLGLRRPSAGRIEADGLDLARITLADIRAHCAAVFQQPVRYPGTLRQNVALAASQPPPVDRPRPPLPTDSMVKGRPPAPGTLAAPPPDPAPAPTGPMPPAGHASPDRAVATALSFSGLDDLSQSPDQLLSPEFGGTDLSGGQWQRLAIARALFRPEAQILVFDEPTSALDPMAELALFERFAALAAGRTALLISHRLGPTRLAGHVLVLDGGRVVEQGAPDALLRSGGLYAAMFEAQGDWYR